MIRQRKTKYTPMGEMIFGKITKNKKKQAGVLVYKTTKKILTKKILNVCRHTSYAIVGFAVGFIISGIITVYTIERIEINAIKQFVRCTYDHQDSHIICLWDRHYQDYKN